MIFEQLRIV